MESERLFEEGTGSSDVKHCWLAELLTLHGLCRGVIFFGLGPFFAFIFPYPAQSEMYDVCYVLVGDPVSPPLLWVSRGQL